MACSKPVTELINECQDWIKLDIFSITGITEALHSVLHNINNDSTYKGLPKDSTDLYNVLNTTHKKTLDKLLKNKILKRSQYDRLLPTNGETDSAKFDVTLICILIINCTKLPPPVTGWDHNKLLPSDHSKAAYVLRAREWRNYLIHQCQKKNIEIVAFDKMWYEGDIIIKNLDYQFDSLPLRKMLLSPEDKLVSQAVNEI